MTVDQTTDQLIRQWKQLLTDPSFINGSSISLIVNYLIIIWLIQKS